MTGKKTPQNFFDVQIKDCSKVKKDDRRYCVRKIADIKRRKEKSIRVTWKYKDRIDPMKNTYFPAPNS